MPDARTRLLALLRERAVLRGDFVLSSGKRSSYYLDARLVTLSGEGSGLVGEIFYHLVRDAGADTVAGLTLGADPIVSAVAVVSGQKGHPIDALIVRKERKGYGAGRLIEGPWREGLRIAILEDAMTTGASSLEAARAVADAGGTIVGLYGLIDRRQGAREAIEAAGYAFDAVYTADEIVTGT